MTKISTFGVPMSGNKGSASMLQSIRDNFPKKFGDVIFNVFTYYPKTDRKLNKAKNVNVLSGAPLSLILYLIPVSFIVFLLNKIKIKLPKSFFGRGIKELIESDIVIDVSGTTFTDEKLVKVLFNVACLLPGILLQKRVIKYSQTMGPFKHPFNRGVAKLILPKLELIVARGRYSENNLKELGLKNCTYCADAAFSMDMSDKNIATFMESEFKNIINATDKKIVGISPNSIVEKYCKQNGINHADIFGKFINYLIDKEFFVILIPHSYRPYTKMRHNNDALTIKEICNYIEDKNSFYAVKKDYDCKQLRGLIGMTDYYVASRFHSMISALSTGVPVLVFGWGKQKYLEVMKEFELEDYTFDYQDLNVDKMIEQFEKIIQNRELVKEKISRNLPKVYTSSMRHLELVEQVLRSD
jgi:polysaccharide pyruvyl transferase WcaK-like protein